MPKLIEDVRGKKVDNGDWFKDGRYNKYKSRADIARIDEYIRVTVPKLKK